MEGTTVEMGGRNLGQGRLGRLFLPPLLLPSFHPLPSCGSAAPTGAGQVLPASVGRRVSTADKVAIPACFHFLLPSMPSRDFAAWKLPGGGPRLLGRAAGRGFTGRKDPSLELGPHPTPSWWHPRIRTHLSLSLSLRRLSHAQSPWPRRCPPRRCPQPLATTLSPLGGRPDNCQTPAYLQCQQDGTPQHACHPQTLSDQPNRAWCGRSWLGPPASTAAVGRRAAQVGCSMRWQPSTR